MFRPSPRNFRFYNLAMHRPSVLKSPTLNNLIIFGLTPNFGMPSDQTSTKTNTLIVLPLNAEHTYLNANNTSSATCKQAPYIYQQRVYWNRPLREKTTWFFWKFKYSGKGLKIKKANKQEQILFNLGSSHISKLLFNKKVARVFRTRKNTYTFLSYRAQQPLTPALMKRVRPFNKYTKRGVRLSRQPIARRFGKVSQLGAKKR